MQAELISIGDELLIGQVVNTNVTTLSHRLNEIGIDVARITTVGDSERNILQAFKRAWTEFDIVIVTGGLGPTHDDISKAAVAKFFRRKLLPDVVIMRDVENRFKKFGYNKMPEANRGQAFVPEGFIALRNRVGTAPGLWYAEKKSKKKSKKVFVILPGVPHEMSWLMTESVVPMLRKTFPHLPFIAHRTLLTAGIGESALAEKLESVISGLPEEVTLAFLPKLGTVRLRISTRSLTRRSALAAIGKIEKKIQKLAGDDVVGTAESSLAESVVRMLISRDLTLSAAESCTGGLFSAAITAVPGSSACFYGSVVSYDNSIKEHFLHISNINLQTHGAVSEAVARLMAENILEEFQTDLAISITGIAGPGGGSREKPVGTTWIALASQDKPTITKHYQFQDTREPNRERAVNAALTLLLRSIDTKVDT